MCGHNSPDWEFGRSPSACEWCGTHAWYKQCHGGNGTQLVWLGSGLNRPCLCHQRSRSSHIHVNCACTRETDWRLPNSFPIKCRITLRQIKGWCCFVRWVSMSNEDAWARHSTSYFKSQFSDKWRGLFSAGWLLGAEWRLTVYVLKINTCISHA